MDRDDHESLKKAGEAHYELLKAGFNEDEEGSRYPIFRVLPAVEPLNATIEINKSLKVEHEVLPYEVLKKYLSKQKLFAIQQCSCRTAAKHSGNPCKRTDENFCVSAGLLAKQVLRDGVGKKVTRDELLEIMKKAEKEGLIHQSTNMKKTSLFICNCCPCCCGVFKQVKELGMKGLAAKPNYQPEVDPEKCVKCQTCVKICPMEAINLEDQIIFNYDVCVGCGLCASNCNDEAITLKKVRNVKLVRGNIGILRRMIKAGKNR